MTHLENALLNTYTDGHYYLSHYVDPQLCENIVYEISHFQLPLAASFYNDVKQHFSYQLYEPDQLLHTPYLHQLITEYLAIYSKIESTLNFCQTKPVIGIHYYPIDGIIDAHRDESKYRNLISIISLSGETPFTLYQDRQTPIVTYNCFPGNLIVLRAPRSIEEKSLRPIHSVGPVKKERYSVVIRHEALHG